MSAEFAMVLPALALVLGVGVVAAQGGVVQVRLADAAADAARMIGRGEAGGAEARVATAHPGASMSVDREGPLVCVTASASPSLGGGLAVAIELSATGCAVDDTTVGGSAVDGITSGAP
ncbi:TadE family type IV pilus minor pilin [Herbiconiux liukaitaii]|uniref:TadE family type IV pilus minor pilin n=1 Tax=Herbiconiux liukaitaii TaxID=3342799 RepID=UPI0035BAD899